MINANEMRIGNWVIGKGKKFQITSVGEDGINMLFGSHDWIGFDYFIEDLEPIPLTPDILIACGFKRDTVRGCFWLNGVRINDDGKPFYLINTLKTKIIGIEIKYLHQLQNLYFSLTEKELEYKPK